MNGDRQLLLIRHAEVHSRWRGVCYGRSDIGLSARGEARSRELSEHFEHRPSLVMSSDLRRARFLAEHLARRYRLELVICPELCERDFGAWELLPWDDIYAETGDEMNGMLDAPDSWRPPGGETTFELRDRVLEWHAGLPTKGCIVAVTHGGPIAALRGTLQGLPVADWPDLMPGWGETVEVG